MSQKLTTTLWGTRTSSTRSSLHRGFSFTIRTPRSSSPNATSHVSAALYSWLVTLVFCIRLFAYTPCTLCTGKHILQGFSCYLVAGLGRTCTSKLRWWLPVHSKRIKTCLSARKKNELAKCPLHCLSLIIAVDHERPNCTSIVPSPFSSTLIRVTSSSTGSMNRLALTSRFRMHLGGGYGVEDEFKL